MTESPSLLLQRAADALDARAAQATPPPWRVGPYGDTVEAGSEWVAYDLPHEADTSWIALMSPAVAAPLVALLRDAARRIERHSHLDPNGSTYQRCALDLARLVLGVSAEGSERSDPERTSP